MVAPRSHGADSQAASRMRTAKVTRPFRSGPGQCRGKPVSSIQTSAQIPANKPSPPGWVLIMGVLALFLVWSTTFITIEALLDHPASGDLRPDGPFNWFTLTNARFTPVAAICAVWCFGFRWRETLALIREHWLRVIVAACFNMFGYNYSLYYAQQSGVAAPIASLMTALAPLFLMLLSAAFLSERMTRRRVIGFAVALSGIVLISQARETTGSTYWLLVLIAAMAPLSWSIYSILTKPVTRQHSPVVWTYLVLVVGGLPCAAMLPFAGATELTQLSPAEWGGMLHLTLGATVFGFAVWSWLLQHLPATVVGMTVFLNPPMTTGAKALLALAFPAVFAFTVVQLEVAGGLLALAGVAIATLKVRRGR